MQEINVEKIMEEIRAEIKEKGYKESDLSFNDIPVREQKNELQEEFDTDMLKNLLHAANTHTRVDYYKPITDTGLKGIIKKAIRKILKPLILPLCMDQESYNSMSVQTLNQLYLYIQMQDQRITELERIICEEK